MFVILETMAHICLKGQAMQSSTSRSPHIRPDGYVAPDSIDELIARYQLGERYFADIDLADGSVLASLDLHDSNFDNALLTDIDFRGANLTQVSFRDANVKCSDFRDANLSHATFERAHIEGALFSAKGCEEAHFTGAWYYGVQLKEGDRPI